MATGRARVVVATPVERRIVETLSRIIPSAAASYEQSLRDLGEPARHSYRGVAHELREALRETLDYLAPDAEVMAERGFVLEEGVTRPTQRQKAQFILRKRRLARDAMQAPVIAVEMIEQMGAAIARSTYARGNRSAHGIASGPEVRQLKMWIDAVLSELLEIHAPPSALPAPVGGEEAVVAAQVPPVQTQDGS